MAVNTHHTTYYDARQIAGLTTLVLLGILAGTALVAIFTAGIAGGLAQATSIAVAVTGFTLVQALLSLLLSLTLAIPVALALDTMANTRMRRLIVSLFTIPLSLPAIVAVIALLALLGRNGLLHEIASLLGYNWRPNIYGLSGIIIAHVFFNMPLAVRIILQNFETIPQEHWKLCESLSFKTRDRFYLLQWPSIRAVLPGLSGLILLLCISSYTIILVLGGGPHTTTLQVAIYQALSFDFDLGRVAALTMAQIGITLALLFALPVAPGIASQNGRGGTRRFHHPGRFARVVSTIIIVLGAGMVAVPLCTIVWAGAASNHVRLLGDPLLMQALATSCAIAVLSAGAAVLASWSLSAALYSFTKTGSHRLARVTRMVPLLLLGLPALVLGVGWFLFATKMGLPLIIAPILIVLANAMMALPFTMQIIQPKLHETFHTNDRLALALGICGWNRLRLIDVPALRGTFLTAALFAIALSLGDLGVVTLFGSDRILTLPALIFQKMGSYRTNDADGLALYLALLIGMITFLATKAHTK